MSSKAIHITDYKTQIPGELDGNGTYWTFPRVNSVNSKGKSLFWEIFVRVFTGSPVLPIPEDSFVKITDAHYRGRLPPAHYAYIDVRSGQVGGKTKETTPTIVAAGKNIGKTNETNAFTQALRDAFGIYNKQLKKASESSGTAGMYPPMLAQVLKDQKKPPEISEKSPVYVQRKFNGVRAVTMLVDGAAVMYSRRKNTYPGYAAIKAECAEILAAEPGVYLDGEIYAHGVPLQDISGHARRDDSPDDPRYKYMVYDCFDPSRPGLTFSERRAILLRIYGTTPRDRVVLVETFTATSMAECERLFNQFLEEKYEGAMVRVDAPYEYSINEKHSRVLLKMKPTYDAEYKIVGWTTGERGKAAAALMIICGAGDKEFPVTPTGELETRVALAAKFGKIEENGRTHFENFWKGKEIVVYYDELSKDGIPQRARTDLRVRDEI